MVHLNMFSEIETGFNSKFTPNHAVTYDAITLSATGTQMRAVQYVLHGIAPKSICTFRKDVCGLGCLNFSVNYNTPFLVLKYATIRFGYQSNVLSYLLSIKL